MHFFTHLTELVLAKDAHISKRRNRVSYTKLYILPYQLGNLSEKKDIIHIIIQSNTCFG